MTVKGVLNGIWQFCRYLFWPQWGSKRRRAQEYIYRMWGGMLSLEEIRDIDTKWIING